MLKTLMTWFQGQGEAARDDHKLVHEDLADLDLPRHAIAAAVLMIEAAMQDEHAFGAQERAAIVSILQRHFGLDEEQADRLLRAAEEEQQDSVELLAYTRIIKGELTPEERVAVIEMLWEVAYADGILHDYEAHLVRRVAGLIYVNDRERGDARKRVLARLGIED